jgi:hypothetical protein
VCWIRYALMPALDALETPMALLRLRWGRQHWLALLLCVVAPPDMARSTAFGNPVLGKILKSLQQDATRVQRAPRRAQQPTGALTLGYMLGPGVTSVGLAPTEHEMIDAVRVAKIWEATQAYQAARQREETAHPEFYRGRNHRINADDVFASVRPRKP